MIDQEAGGVEFSVREKSLGVGIHADGQGNQTLRAGDGELDEALETTRPMFFPLSLLLFWNR